MSLQLLPMTPSDTLSWTRIRTLAYQNPTHYLVHGNQPLSESSIQAGAHARKNEIGKPNTWHWKIVDTELYRGDDDPEDNPGRTIAFAVWSLCNADNSGIDLEKTNKTDEEEGTTKRDKDNKHYVAPEVRLDMLTAIFTPMQEAQLEIMGTVKPFLMLNSLATHPEHHRRGAGGILLDWGLQKADQEGLETYLNASMVGRKMYEATGFELVKALWFDREKWGGEGKEWYGSMVRKPLTVA
jgi:GNAT superfamily N-acetyltransferase